MRLAYSEGFLGPKRESLSTLGRNHVVLSAAILSFVFSGSSIAFADDSMRSFGQTAQASSSPLIEPKLLRESNAELHVKPGSLVAQADADDAYDPFADYSEFEENMDEEEDINFFRNGRLMTLGFLGGYRGWTGNLGQIYSSGADFGLFLSYFFDLRFALQLGYMDSNHSVYIQGPTGSPVAGTADVSEFSLLVKYYFNTQNVTRGLADLNPFIVVGFSQIYRDRALSGGPSNVYYKDSALAIDTGGGIEIPMLRNKMYFGIEGIYQYVNFSDSGTTILDGNDQSTGVVGSGQTFLLLGILGVNF